jgi:riboflavin kinase/FMN adenylyltransferase
LEVIRGGHNIRPEHHGCVATIGNFDGVHLGHRALIGQLAALGRERAVPTTLVTFEPQPQEFFAGENAPPRLTRLREKLSALRALPLDRVALLRFDARLCAMSPVEFVESFLVAGLGVQVVVAGDDFRFGYRGEGNFDLLVSLGERHGFDVVRRETCCVRGGRVSSSWIRDALANDEIAIARELLGRPYAVSGRVARGEQRGRTIGFPTLNIPIRRYRSALRGVYAVRVAGLEERELAAVANLGTRPTVDGRGVVLEVHVFDWIGDAYGRCVDVSFVAKIRDERKFDTFDALKLQIGRDSDRAREMLGRPA